MSLVWCLHTHVSFTTYCDMLLLNALWVSRVYALCRQQKLFEERNCVKSKGHLLILLDLSPAFNSVTHLLFLKLPLHFSPWRKTLDHSINSYRPSATWQVPSMAPRNTSVNETKNTGFFLSLNQHSSGEKKQAIKIEICELNNFRLW